MTVRRAALAVALVLGAACSDGDGTAAPERSAAAPIAVTSTAFTDGEAIPAAYTCEGEDVSPPLAWSSVPTGAREIAIVMADLDAGFTHWLVAGIDPSVEGLEEGVLPQGAVQGTNDFAREGYDGPCPPAGPPHRYRFVVYALSGPSGVEPGADVTAVTEAIDAVTIAQGQIEGTYTR